MTERLSVELVSEYNRILCNDTGESHALLDPNGLAAALERPWSGFGDFEAFPTVLDKAAALLHGLASRQVFENGNKRTAWAAAVTFLDLNGIDIGRVETIQADMFVRAAGLDHSLEVSDLSEWFRVAERNHAAAVARVADHPQVEYLVPCEAVFPKAGGVSDVLNLGKAGVIFGELPGQFVLTTLMQVHWFPDDVSQTHEVSWTIEQEGEIVAFVADYVTEYELGPLMADPSRPGQWLPLTTSHTHYLLALNEGLAWIVTWLDGRRAGRLPIRVTIDPLADVLPGDVQVD